MFSFHNIIRLSHPEQVCLTSMFHDVTNLSHYLSNPITHQFLQNIYKKTMICLMLRIRLYELANNLCFRYSFTFKETRNSQF